MTRSPNSEAQQSTSRSSTASPPTTLANVSCMPAKDVPAVSSDVADERTATGTSSPSRRYAPSTCSRREPGTPARRTSDRRRSAASASAAGSSARARASSKPVRSSSRTPPSSIAARQASAVTTNPGGTGSPAAVSSPRLAPLPPAVAVSDAASSSNQAIRVAMACLLVAFVTTSVPVGAGPRQGRRSRRRGTDASGSTGCGGDAMKAWVVRRPAPIDEGPLALVDRPVPEPGPGEVRVRVAVCGVCRTDLHLAEGDLPPRHPDVVRGHEVVGVVEARGPGAERFEVGERVGIAWLRGTCGTCRFCRRGDENLCLSPSFTGWDADGGYAEHAVVDERFAYRIPDAFTDEEAAPLLCAGIIGYRALRRAELPPGGRLGIYGFGASAHLAAQVALAEGATVHVMTRAPEARRLALELGAASAGDTYDPP